MNIMGSHWQCQAQISHVQLETVYSRLAEPEGEEHWGWMTVRLSGGPEFTTGVPGVNSGQESQGVVLAQGKRNLRSVIWGPLPWKASWVSGMAVVV